MSALFATGILTGATVVPAEAQRLASHWKMEGSAGTGHSVAQVGDVNGDGYHDIAVGNPFFVNGNVQKGKVSVFYGSSTGFALSESWAAEGSSANEHFGWSIAGMADINNDGYHDVVTGAPGTSTVQGKVYVYYGSASGLSLTPSVTINGHQTGERFGFAIAAADINNDGRSDLIIGAPYNQGSASSGKVYTYKATSTGLTSSPVWSLSGSSSLFGFGWSLAIGSVTATSGQFNLVIGAPGINSSDASAVVLTDLLDDVTPPSTKQVIDGVAGSRFGHSVAIAGKINQDGYEDIIIGAPHFSNGHDLEGQALLYLGSSGTCSLAWEIEGNETSAKFGTSVAGKGRINSDSNDDVAITAPGSAYSLCVYTGNSASLATTRYTTTDLSESFSTATFFRENSMAKGGLIIGSPTVSATNGSGSKYIKEFDDWIKREGAAHYDPTNDLSLSTYPNPAQHQVNFSIVAGNVSGSANIDIINTLGTIVHSAGNIPVQQVTQSFALNLPSLPAGIYYASVRVAEQTIMQPIHIIQ